MGLLTGRRVLVTGAAGFLGSHLVPRLIDEGADVCALDQPNARCWPAVDEATLALTLKTDVTALAGPAFDERLGDVDVIFHLAAVGVTGDVTDVRSIVTGNVEGTLAALAVAQRLRSRLVYCGSCFEYGSGERWTEDALPAPTTEYGAAKSGGWLVVNAFAGRTGLQVVSLRPFTLYGPMEAPGRLVPSVIRGALAGRPIDLTPGDQLRDFVYVEDAVDAFIAAATTDAAVGGTFNVCSGTTVTIRHLVRTILDCSGSVAEPRFGALAYRGTELAVLSGDPTRAERVLGWRARVSLEDGLARTVAWFRTVGAALPEYQLS